MRQSTGFGSERDWIFLKNNWTIVSNGLKRGKKRGLFNLTLTFDTILKKNTSPFNQAQQTPNFASI